ncbi:hypothetical protein [Pedobacter helvus]|uniref:Uncharacterized protein n=1 Tax=Pedobacter helvus TaxID=2563444 RepID=A0ABW9JFN0_9SPHI|nr:hypothetical protein [Pedobacter ureilyticus]
MDTIWIEIYKQYFNAKELKELLDKHCTWYNGERYYKNLMIKLTKNKLIIKGSLNRYYHGSNQHLITFLHVTSALNRISEVFGFDIRNGIITRVDFAWSFYMKHKAVRYINEFRCPELFKCHTVTNCRNLIETLYYHKNDKSFSTVFYDKGMAMVAKEGEPTLISTNNLRFEIRLSGAINILNTLGFNSVAALFNYNNYLKLVKEWHDEYFKIPRLIKSGAPEIIFRTPTDLKEWLMTKGLSKCNVPKLLECIELNERPQYRARMKDVVNYTMNRQYIKPELKDELDSKIKAVHDSHLNRKM